VRDKREWNNTTVSLMKEPGMAKRESRKLLVFASSSSPLISLVDEMALWERSHMDAVRLFLSINCLSEQVMEWLRQSFGWSGELGEGWVSTINDWTSFWLNRCKAGFPF